MSDTKNLTDFDVRVRDRNLKAGLISQEQVREYVAALPDRVDSAQRVEVTQPGFDSVEEEDDDGEPESDS